MWTCILNFGESGGPEGAAFGYQAPFGKTDATGSGGKEGREKVKKKDLVTLLWCREAEFYAPDAHKLLTRGFLVPCVKDL